MSNKQFLPLPTSVDNFAELITSSCYYVDKTPYLKEVFADITSADDKSKVKGSNVLLFTRVIRAPFAISKSPPITPFNEMEITGNCPMYLSQKFLSSNILVSLK